MNADCPNIFYANWCNDNSRTLEPPKDYKTPFNWSTYLIKCKATPVPKNILVSTVNTTVSITDSCNCHTITKLFMDKCFKQMTNHISLSDIPIILVII